MPDEVRLTVQIEADPPTERLDDLARTAPDNPFLTGGYTAARAGNNARVWGAFFYESAGLVGGCSIFVRQGRLSRVAEIDALPHKPPPPGFWERLRERCRAERVSDLVIRSFGSLTARIPTVGHEVWRHRRCEYRLELSGPETRNRLSAHHRRLVRRAEKIGMELRRGTDIATCENHARLVTASGRRRRENGSVARAELSQYVAFASHGVGEVFQAYLGGAPVSSALLLRAPRGGYYHSAGTSPKGMAVGASHFLVARIAEVLAEESVPILNLGGAHPSEEGLARFKRGFGAEPVELEAAGFCFWPAPARAIRWLGRRVALLASHS